MIKWICSIGLEEFAYCLQQSGIHGSVIALDETFDAGSLTYHLQIPSTNTQVNIFIKEPFSPIILCGHAAISDRLKIILA